MKKILIIDDNPSVLEVIAEMLQEEGYQTILAQSGNQGIQLQNQDPADLIITDLCMPEKSGIQTIEELTHQFPNIKIIAISGGPGSQTNTGFQVYEQMLEAALKAGAHLTLTKTIEINTLTQNIQSLIGD